MYLLSGTSTAGKSTTAHALKLSFEKQGKATVIIAYDVLIKQLETQFVDFLDTVVKAAGFVKGFQDTLDTIGDLSKAQQQLFESLVDNKGTNWMQQQLANSILVQQQKHSVVIVDTLDTHDIVAKHKKITHQAEYINILLEVDIRAFPARVHMRNMKSLDEYKLKLDSNAYENCRDPLDMVEQFADFYSFKECDRLAENALTKQDIESALQSSAKYTVELLELLAKAHTHNAKRYETMGEIDNSLKFTKRALALQEEKEQFLKELDLKISTLLSQLLGSSPPLFVQCRPLQKFDLVVRTDKLTVTEVISAIHDGSIHKKSDLRKFSPSTT